MSEEFVLDCIRFVFFLSCSAIAGFTMSITWSYVKSYLRHRRRAREGTGKAWERLLPLHVALIGLAHLMLVMMSVFEVVDRLGWDTIHWRTPVLAVANLLGAYALWVILRYQKHRRHDRQG